MQRLTPQTLARRSHGFTLIELMAVVVILGILAAVAIGAYAKHIRNAHRTEVMADMSNLVLREKNFMAVTGHYASTTNNENDVYPTKTEVSQATQPIQWDPINDPGNRYTSIGATGQFFRGGDAVHGFDAIRFLPENSKSWCGYGVTSGWGSNANPAINADQPPFGQTLASEVWPNSTPEDRRYFARDWFYAFAICDFDHDGLSGGNYWAFTTTHYQSEINYNDSKDGTYKAGE